MVDFLILGATGLQGSAVTRFLKERGHSVAVSGRSAEKLEKLRQKHDGIPAKSLELQNHSALAEIIQELQPKVVINCAEGDWNLAVYQAALAGGSHVIDLGSEIPMTKDQLALSDQFAQKGLIAITGCGSTPGVNNVMLDFMVKQFETVESIEAGFAWNSNIKSFVVPFSMESILEEFTHPADAFEQGSWVKKTPMETLEDREFHQVGLQKVFLVRHPEPYTFYENYKHKGTKNVLYFAGFPQHSYERIVSFIPAPELLEKKVAVVEGKEIPFGDLTTELLARYPMPIGYEETENLWVLVEGTKNGREERMLMECIVPTLPDWKEAGCNIDTSFPMAIIGEMILRGTIQKSGSFAPEQVVPPEQFFLRLNQHGMTFWKDGQKIELSGLEESLSEMV